jgi:hypothetical protein
MRIQGFDDYFSETGDIRLEIDVAVSSGLQHTLPRSAYIPDIHV